MPIRSVSGLCSCSKKFSSKKWGAKRWMWRSPPNRVSTWINLNRFFKFIQVETLFGGDLHIHRFAPHFFEENFLLHEHSPDTLRIGIGLIDFVNGNDHGDI